LRNRSADGTDPGELRVVRLYILLLLVIFVTLVLRLLVLQVLRTSKLQLDSLDNIMQSVETPAPRGFIFDRAGIALAKNVTSFQLLYIPPRDLADYYPDADEKARLELTGGQYSYMHREKGKCLDEVMRLGAYLGLPYPELMKRLEKQCIRTYGKSMYGYQPVVLLDELSYEQVVYLEEHREEYEGFFIDDYAFKRTYPLESAAAHVIGYTGWPSEKDAEKIKSLGYTAREKVGKEGAEQTFEAQLHGRPGRRDIEIDRNRLFQRIVREVPPKKGNDLYLTVDAGVQKKAQQLIASRPGAIVIASLVPGHEGEIITLASGPSFDPSRINETEYFQQMNFDDPRKPLFNRAYRNTYPPGSTFKMVTMTAALTTEKVSPNSGFYCGGGKKLGKDSYFKCHNSNGHGQINLMGGLAKSCDVVFYETGLRLEDPPEDIARYARLFGYGAPVGLELPSESKGVVPDRKYRERIYAEPRGNRHDRAWYSGHTLNYAIGQGDLLATPIQVLWATMLIATRGERYPPQLLYARGVDRQIVKEKPGRPQKVKLDEDILAIVEQGMRQAVSQGTCKALDDLGLKVCAKTGTAEQKGHEDHSWVVGYYPQGAPRYAFVCFFQNGGHGSDAAVPAAKELLKYLKANDPLKNAGKEADPLLSYR
jgi:penicillin-binding protein 2